MSVFLGFGLRCRCQKQKIKTCSLSRNSDARFCIHRRLHKNYFHFDIQHHMLLPICRESQHALERIHNLSFQNRDDLCHANEHNEAIVSH